MDAVDTQSPFLLLAKNQLNLGMDKKWYEPKSCVLGNYSHMPDFIRTLVKLTLKFVHGWIITSR